MITIINLTPHPVTIIRPGREPVTYPACAPGDLPRATEAPVHADMRLTDRASDGQGGYANAVSMQDTGLVDQVGYVGVDGLPALSADERMFGVATLRIVSIVTAIGALAAGRGIEDLLVPMGQVRDTAGRIIGATGLAPATSLLTPMYRALVGGLTCSCSRSSRPWTTTRSSRPDPPPCSAALSRYPTATPALPDGARDLAV